MFCATKVKTHEPRGKTGFGRDSQVMYVWFDALINYMSGVDGLDASKPLSRFWPASMHIVGKDYEMVGFASR